MEGQESRETIDRARAFLRESLRAALGETSILDESSTRATIPAAVQARCNQKPSRPASSHSTTGASAGKADRRRCGLPPRPAVVSCSMVPPSAAAFIESPAADR